VANRLYRVYIPPENGLITSSFTITRK